MDFKLQLFMSDNQKGGFSETYFATANSVSDMNTRAGTLITRRQAILDDTYVIEEGRISVIESGFLNLRQTALVVPGPPAAGGDDGHPDIKDRKGNPNIALLLRVEAGLSYRGRFFLRGLKPARYDGELFVPGPIATALNDWATELTVDFMLRVHHKKDGSYLLVPITRVFAGRIVSRRIGRSILTPRGRRTRRK